MRSGPGEIGCRLSDVDTVGRRIRIGAMVRTSNNNFDLYRQQHQAEISAAYSALSAYPEAPAAVVRRQWTGLYRRYQTKQGGDLADIVRVRKVLEDAGLFW
jgi:hypothetical protein